MSIPLETAQTPTTRSPRRGKLIGPKPPFKLHEVWAIRMRLHLQGQVRDLALFNLAIDSKLRGCDLAYKGRPPGFAGEAVTV